MIQIYLTLISISILLSLACSNRSGRVSDRSGAESAPTESESSSNNANAAVTDTQAYLGIRSFSEIQQTFITVTGVTPNNNTIRQYDLVRFTLPSETNDIRAFNASHQAAIVKLASEFCVQLVSMDSFRADMQALQLSFNDRFMGDPVAQAKAGRYFAEKFWSLSSGESDFAIAEKEAQWLVQQFDQQQNFNPANAAFGICTAILASFQTLEK